MIKLRARLLLNEGGGHYFIVPDSTAAEAGLKFRDRVHGTIAGVPFRSSLARYSGLFHVGIQNSVLQAAPVTVGDMVELTLELDPEPPPGEIVPDDILAALQTNPKARAGFEGMGPAHRREHVKYVLEAKRVETRSRRITATIKALEAYADELAAKRRK